MDLSQEEIDSFFSPDYFAARDKFIAAATSINAKIKTILHPTAKGPNNKDIYLDCATFGNPSSNTLIVLISGTHGPEAYAGSAIQTGILSNFTKLFGNFDCKLAFIHAHNPFGFAWDLRFNEDNIDLNRNYIDDFSHNLPKNPEYSDLIDIVSISEFDEETIAQSHSKLMRYAAKYGYESLQTALTKGQYDFPKGIYFGGHKKSWSNIEISKTFDEITIGVDNLIAIDIHTGLGNFGIGQLITSQDLQSEGAKFAKSIWGDELTSTKSNSISADIIGSLDAYINRKYAHLNTASIAIEYGTIDPLSVLKATQGANYLISSGLYESEIAKEIRALSREAFYPQNSQWNYQIFQKAITIIKAIKLANI